MWDLLFPQCLTLPSLLPAPVAVALAEDEEEPDEDIDPCLEERSDDAVTMTLRREASIHRRNLSRRWDMA